MIDDPRIRPEDKARGKSEQENGIVARSRRRSHLESMLGSGMVKPKSWQQEIEREHKEHSSFFAPFRFFSYLLDATRIKVLSWNLQSR